MHNELHLKAPGDWINDPNGFIYYKGQYHLFYQYFPCAPHWGIMHWGHAISEDLVHWKHLGIALYPTKPYDRNGCFSGSAIERADGQMALYYTGVRYLTDHPDDINQCPEGQVIQSQAMITSEDGFTFDPSRKEQVISPFENTEIGDPYDFRDPKVFCENGKYYMVTASTHEKKEGVLLIHESEDGHKWQLKTRVADKKLGIILECPDLFKVDGKWIFMCSPIAITENEMPVEGDVRANQSIIGIVDFDPVSGTLELNNEFRFLDYGMDIYAPQSNLDKDGNRTYIGWMRMPLSASPENNTASKGRPWNGMMSLPRIIQIKDGKIYTPVHPEVDAYFENEEKQEDKIEIHKVGSHNCYTKDIAKWTISDMNSVNRKYSMLINEGELLTIERVQIGMKSGKVFVDRTNRMPREVEAEVNRISKSPVVGENCKVDIYLEANLVEVFINDGEYVISNIIY